jgi:membrane protein
MADNVAGNITGASVPGNGTETAETRRIRLAAAAAAAERAKALAGKTSKATPSFLKYLMARFGADGCLQVAGALAYTSLLAIVPLLAIGLAMFAAFSGFESQRNDIINSLTAGLTTDTQVVVRQYLARFVSNAGKTTGAGVLGLAVTAILLIHTIQVAFDRIWGTASRKARWGRFPIYWALITLGPMLFGISFSISTYYFRTWGKSDLYGVSAGIELLGNVAPYVLEGVGFALFYWLMPTRPVRLPDAIWGGFTAALLFEVVKRLFGLYLHYVPYKALYGALATLPIFLLWMYLAWVTALIGAEVTAALPEWRSGRRSVAPHHRRGDQLSLALAALVMLKEARTHGAGMRTQEIARALEADPSRLQAILEHLKDAHILALNDANRFVLSRDLNGVTLHQLCHILGLSLSSPEAGRAQRVGPLVQRLADQERDMLSQSVDAALLTLSEGSATSGAPEAETPVAAQAPAPAEENGSSETADSAKSP